MYKVSTYFIKAQLLGLTKTDLVDYYNEELQIQNVSKTNIEFSTIKFFNEPLKSFMYRSTSRFSSFSTGTILINENETEFIVTLQADMTNILIMPGLLASVVTILFLFASGFDLIALGFGLGMFLLVLLVSYAVISISFPVYFTSLRNDIERQIQTNR